MLNLGWAHDTRDNVLFPNKGVYQRISTEIGVPGLDLEYYKLEYKHSWYWPVSNNVTLMLNGEIGYADSYGDRDYPFFKNFYIGGVNSVRGFETSSIGPREIDPVTGEDFAVGGTKRLLGNAEIYFPVPGMKDNKQLRLSTFLDAGAVYTTEQSFEMDELRYSTGLGISWYSPFGPIKLVFAKALNEKDGDKTQTLQFQLGSQF
jgi:outer membrane protein insertion porin family